MKNFNILYVEDNPGDVRLVKEYLKDAKQFSSTLIVAGTLRDAHVALTDNTVDIILLDLSLPDSSGPETFLSIQKKSEYIPIVLITGQTDEELALQLITEGAQDYINKSHLTGMLLEKTIDHSFERNKLRKSLRSEMIQRNSAFDQLWESEQKYHLLFDRMLNGFALHEIICDEKGKPVDYSFLEVNSAFGKITQLDVHSIIGKRIKEVLPMTEECWIETYGSVALSGKPIQFTQYSHAMEKYFNVSAFSPQPMKFATIIEDISDEVISKIQIQKLNRINRVLSNINQLIVRVRDIDTIFKEACSIAVNDGKFLMAWIGMRNEATNKLDVVASAGNTDNYLEKINIDFSDPIRSAGPTGRAVTSGFHQFIADVETDPSLAPWRADAIRVGYKSSAAFPLTCKGKIVGAMTFYAVEKNFFTAEEIALLDELSTDISFAIEVMEVEQERNTYFEHLQQSEHRYRELFDANPHAMWVYDVETLKFLAVNDTAIVKYGYSREEFLNMTIKDIRPEEDVDLLIKDIEETNNKHIKVAQQWRHQLKDGKIIDVEITSHALLFGTKSARLVLANDITEKKRAQEALIESEKRFRSVVEEAVEIIFTVDTKGFISYVNPVGIKVSGYSADELKQMRYVDLALPENKSKITRHYLRQWKERIPQTTTEHPIRTKCGEIKWLNQNVRLIVENGEPKGFYAISRDVTERKKTEYALIESEERYRLLFENSGEAIMLTQDSGEILSANPAACRMFGKTEQEICAGGRSGITDLTDPRLNVALEERKRTGTFKGELRMKRNDGTLFPAFVSTQVYVNTAGDKKTSIVISDLSEIKHSEEILKEKMQELERFNDLMVGREMKMLELKKEINQLLKEQGKKEKYKID